MSRKPKPVSALDAHLGYWLRFVSNQVSHAFSLKLAARDVTVAEWVVMRDLYDRQEAVPSELAERLGMTRGAISKLADRLEAKSLSVRAAGDGDDRRYQTLTLTPRGRAIVPELSALADRNDAEFFGHLDATERAKIESVMKDIVRRQGMRSVPID
jgi:DNA-binding MarR family transcriptional regulator